MVKSCEVREIWAARREIEVAHKEAKTRSNNSRSPAQKKQIMVTQRIIGTNIYLRWKNYIRTIKPA